MIHVRCDSDVFAQEFSRRVRTIQTVTIRFKLFKLGSKVLRGCLKEICVLSVSNRDQIRVRLFFC